MMMPERARFCRHIKGLLLSALILGLVLCASFSCSLA